MTENLIFHKSLDFFRCGFQGYSKFSVGNLFRRFQIIELLDRDLGNEESRIIIYNSIIMAVRIEDIKQAYEKLELYRKGKGSDEKTETDEAD